MTRVFAIDPGLTRCGLGVVDGGPSRTAAMVSVGVVGTPAHVPLPERLLVVSREVDSWITRYRPDVVALERVFSQHNVQTVMGTAQVSGVCLLMAAQHGIPVALHTPSEVKAAVTGHGRADKAQVTTVVTKVLKLSTPPKPADAADALALAICHLWRGDRTAPQQAAHTTLTPAQRQWLAALSTPLQSNTGGVRTGAHQQRGGRSS